MVGVKLAAHDAHTNPRSWTPAKNRVRCTARPMREHCPRYARPLRSGTYSLRSAYAANSGTVLPMTTDTWTTIATVTATHNDPQLTPADATLPQTEVTLTAGHVHLATIGPDGAAPEARHTAAEAREMATALLPWPSAPTWPTQVCAERWRVSSTRAS